ncbi:MAG: hypothetical protein ABW158_20255 [Candidatus Thiodiazotropha sp. 6PDIVS]
MVVGQRSSRIARHGACHHWATSVPAIHGMNHAACTLEQAPRRAGALVAVGLLLPLKAGGMGRCHTGCARVASEDMPVNRKPPSGQSVT